MSTKTTIKRIALVAVSALGLGVVTAVAPASANTTLTSITSVSVTAPVAPRVGSTSIVPVTITFPAATAADTYTVMAKVISAPLTGGPANAPSVLISSLTGTAANFGTSPLTFSSSAGAALAGATYAGGTLSAGLTNGAPNTGTYGAATAQGTIVATGTAGNAAATVIKDAASAGDTSATVYLAVTPDLAGSYTILVSATSGDYQSYKSGDTSALLTFSTGGTVSNIVLTTVGGGTHTATNGVGALVKVTVTDAAGVATTLGANDAIALSTTGGYVKKAALASGVPTSQTPVAATETLTNADFVNGQAFVNVLGTAKGTAILTATGSGTISSSVLATKTFTALAAASATVAGSAYNIPASNSLVTKGLQSIGGTYTTSTTATSDTLEITFTAATAAQAGNAYWTIADNAGKISGAPASNGLSWNVGFTIATGDTYAAYSVSHPAYTTAAATRYTFDNSLVASAKAVTSAASTAKTFVPDVDTLMVAPASAVSFKVFVKDQFGYAKPNVAVTATIIGRNAAVTPLALVTDANGYTTVSYTDLGTSATTNTVDTIQLTATNATTKNVTVNYNVNAAAVGTVTILGGNNTTTGVAAQTTQFKDINAGDGAESSTYTAVATVKDANGALMVGVPVTFTITGTGAAITSTSKTLYTGSTGTATAYVYGWLEGSYTVTATAGGKTGTAVFAFRQSANGEERAVSVTTTGNVVTAKVVDRFGNPVPSVTVYATQAGGVTINSKTRDFATTDNAGLVDFLVSGSGTVTVSTVAWTALPGAYGSGQTSAPKGYLYNSISATTLATYAFTAYTAGTTTVDEVGVGASYDAAGVSSASVDVATTSSSDSVDAANEATDAANAATDAANAAAEAADAATAAAQDAQAAVAALATQVASLIAGIKAQITTLTNLVIKIQKKVKA